MNRNSVTSSISFSRKRELCARRSAPSSTGAKKSGKSKQSSAAAPKKLIAEKKSSKAMSTAPDVLEPTSHMRLITAQELIEKTVPQRK